MRIHYDWLQDYCPCSWEPEKAAEELTLAGLNVEEIEELEDGSPVFDVEVTANRSDCNSYIGVARELSVLSDTELKMPEPDNVPETVSELENVTVEVRDEDHSLCPRYTARIVRDVTVDESPDWLIARLEAMGIQPVNNIADISNYVLFETGQPLHAFDLETLQDDTVLVRRADDGEEITTIDGTTRTLREDMLVIADGRDPAAIAGVMGGERTEVTGSTRDVLIESALFDPVNIRRTSRALGLSTESSYRFERSPDPEQVLHASSRAAELMAEIAGGTPDTTVVDRKSQKHREREQETVTLRVPRLQSVTGLDIDRNTAVNILSGLGFEANEKKEDRCLFQVPSYRPDVSQEVDLIEEVIRIYGYNRVSDAPNVGQTLALPDRDTRVRRKIRQLLSGFGCNEVCSFPFIDSKEQCITSYWTDEEPVGILDAYGEVDRFLRRSLVPSFLNILNTNHGYGKENLSFFEIARSYRWRKEGEVDEQKLVGLLREDGFRRIKGDVEQLVNRLLRADVRYEPADLSVLHPDESAEIWIGQIPAGYVGRIKRTLLEDRNIQGTPFVAELDYNVLKQRAVLRREFEEFSRYPPSEKDLAFIVGDGVSWSELKQTIQQAGPGELEEVNMFDVYRGDDMPENRRSIAIRLVFRSNEGTLEREQVTGWMKDIVEAVEDQLNAELRGDM